MSGPDPLVDPWGHQRLELTPEAARLLGLLRELGHLDGALADEFFSELSPPVDAFTPETRVIDRQDLRRLVGAFLFTRSTRLTPESLELLSREWPLLFG